MAAKSDSILAKLYRREVHGSDRCHRKARPQRLFKGIPRRLCFKLSSLVPESDLEAEGYVFLGFTKCGQFVVSYTSQLEMEDMSRLPLYVYKLQWWWFVPSRKLVKVSEVQLFGEQEVIEDLALLFCEWPEDRSHVMVFGHSFPAYQQDGCICYLTITAIPSLAPCKACRELQTGPDDMTLCLKHCFCLHTKYELTPPFPVVFPKVQLKCDGQVILNTGDSIVSLHIDLDGMECKPKGPFNDISVLKIRENLTSDKNKDVCVSPEPNRDFVWSGAGNSVPSAVDSSSLDSQPGVTVRNSSEPFDILDTMIFTSSHDRESQKENTTTNGLDLRFERIKSPPKSPKSSISQGPRTPVSLPTERWFDAQSLPHANNVVPATIASQSTSRRSRTSSMEIHTRDLYHFDSDDSEDNTYSFMCPSVPKVSALKSKSPGTNDVVSHTNNHVISPSVHVQRQLAFSINKASPLNNSQALNCDSPRQSYEHLLSKGIAGIQRSFFSPSNSENSFGGTSSSADSVIVQVNDSRTVTHSWRKFSYHGDTAVDSTLVIEDDFDLAYRSVLPVELRGTKNRKLALSLDPSNDANKEQICVKQLTFDIEHYMEEAIRSSAKWADRYIAFTNYDLQIIDVYPDRNEVLAKVFALISARESSKKPKFYKRSRGKEKLYETNFVFEVNIQSGVYETLEIADLRLMDDKDLRPYNCGVDCLQEMIDVVYKSSKINNAAPYLRETVSSELPEVFRLTSIVKIWKDWKPGLRECAARRRHVFIPQSTKRCVHVLSNEPVFRGESLQMMLLPEHYVAMVL